MIRQATFLFVCLFVINLSICQNAKPEISKNIEPRIVNGTPAYAGQFPWQAALFFQQQINSEFWFCSGAIIDKDWILTAAHCVNGAESVLVYAGLTDISEEVLPTAISKEFIAHEEFTDQSLANDIALVKLPESLVFDGKTNAIELSSDGIDTGSNVAVSGWGQSNRSGISPHLNYVNMVSISNEECQEAYGNSEIIVPEMVCAVSNLSITQGPCNGDSGGPVVINFNSEPRQVAIISFVAESGCESDSPSGYTRIAPYFDWVKEKIGM